MSDFPSIAVVDVTERCQLACPICHHAPSGERNHHSLEQIDIQFDSIIKNQTAPSAILIAGGEPTIHPQIDEILLKARSLPIARLMLSTNGIRISQDDEFARRLAALMPNFEIHLQFDSLRPSCLRDLRGEDLSSIRSRALSRLNKLSLSTMLVINLKNGQNGDEIGEIIEFAIKQPCVQGVIFRPIQPSSLGEVQEQIINQSQHFKGTAPIPINFDSVLIARLGPSKSLLNPQMVRTNTSGPGCR